MTLFVRRLLQLVMVNYWKVCLSSSSIWWNFCGKKYGPMPLQKIESAHKHLIQFHINFQLNKQKNIGSHSKTILSTRVSINSQSIHKTTHAHNKKFRANCMEDYVHYFAILFNFLTTLCHLSIACVYYGFVLCTPLSGTFMNIA